jgi:hypothetical protein
MKQLAFRRRGITDERLIIVHLDECRATLLSATLIDIKPARAESDAAAALGLGAAERHASTDRSPASELSVQHLQ